MTIHSCRIWEISLWLRFSLRDDVSLRRMPKRRKRVHSAVRRVRPSTDLGGEGLAKRSFSSRYANFCSILWFFFVFKHYFSLRRCN